MPAAATLQDRYRQAIGRFATGVTVITALADGRLAGMTASAVASLSLDPPMLLVCVNNRLPTHTALEHGRRFGVNVLGEAMRRWQCVSPGRPRQVRRAWDQP